MSDIHLNEPEYGTGKKNLKTYVVGLLLCVILTLIPFGAVMYHVQPKSLLLLLLFVCAFAQFLVQVTCFLRLNAQTDQGRTNIMSFIFSIVVVVVLIAGTVWIMINLNYNMMH